MSMLDKLKSLVKGHEDKVQQGVDKGGDAVDKKTGNKYQGQVDTGQKKMMDEFGGGDSQSGERPPQG